MGGQLQLPMQQQAWEESISTGSFAFAKLWGVNFVFVLQTLHQFMKASNVASCFWTGEPTICKGLNKLTRVSKLLSRLESESILKSFSKARLLIIQQATLHLSLFPLIKLPVSSTLAYLPISSLRAYPCSELSENSEVILNCSEKSPFREAYIVPGELPVSFL